MPLAPEMGILRELSARVTARPDGGRARERRDTGPGDAAPLGKRPGRRGPRLLCFAARLAVSPLAGDCRPAGPGAPAGWPGGTRDDHQEGEAKPRSGYPRCLAGGRLDHTRMTTL